MINIGFLAFAIFHAVVPAVCVALYGASPAWILGSILFSLAVFRTTQYSNTTTVKTILCLVSGLSMLLTLMLGVSYYMQGTGFNDQYFYHLDTETLVIAARAYGSVFFPSVVGLALAFFAPLVLYRKSDKARVDSFFVVTLWIVAAVTLYPVHSFISYRSGSGDEMSEMMPRLPDDVGVASQSDPSSPAELANPADESQPIETVGKTRKNIILIYAEGLEQLYFDKNIFGDILPNIRALSEQAHRFTNVYQVRGATWTIAGVVASQCGFPLVVSNHLASNSTMASIEKPFEDEQCLADILQDSGYETVYMGGAPLAFAGKGNFLKTHGYKKVLGRAALKPLLQDPEYNMGWGLYDDSLFGFALYEIKTLERGDKPYLLTLLTLDTHHPRGHPSKSCERLEDNTDPMSNAVYCSDQLISDFVKRAMEIVDMDRTVIVIFSDHLAMRNSLWEKLKANSERRRLTWMVFDNQPGTVSEQIATHFDFAPTLLEQAGFDGYPVFGQGNSLISNLGSRKDGAPPVVNMEQAPRSLVSDASVKESGFSITYNDLTISVGDLAIRATKNGWKFTSGLFLLVFDEDGKVSDTVNSKDFTQLMMELDNRFVVGISIYEDGAEYEDQFFYGRITQDLGKFTVQSLNTDVQVEADRLVF